MVLTLLSLSLLVYVGWAQTCPSYKVGTIKNGGQREPETTTVYINHLEPSPCAGRVYGWHYCSNPTNGDAPFQVQVSIYRSTTEDSYQLVSGSLYELTIDDIGAYTCRDISLDPLDYFSIEQGDMVAACWSTTNRVELFGHRWRNSLVSGGQCSQEIITETSSIDRRVLFLSAHINVNECALDEDNCHERATCSDMVGDENSYNCTCNTGYIGDGFSCIGDSSSDGDIDNKGGMGNGTATDNEGGTNNATNGSSNSHSGAVSGGTVAAIVVVLLLVLAALLIAAVLVGILFYRRRLDPRQATQATKHDNELYAKHYEEMSDAAAVAYEVPQQSVQHESVYEMEPQSKMYATTEVVYEPVTDMNIYSTPELPSKEISFCELPADYADMYQQTVATENIYGSATPYETPAQEEDRLYEQISSYHMQVIPRRDIQIISHLGSGQFGSVNKGVWKHGNKREDVAVKTLTDAANTVKFLQEAAIMVQFKHPNILTLHGVISAGDPKMIVVELMHNGDLKEYVTNMRPDPGQLVAESVPKQLLNISKQVALGLHYLACRGFVHRDLAARNILVSNKLCKIADFGMSRDLADDDIYVSHGGVIPVRWTAPEAMTQKIYSTASDVWSYGCVLYEIWSLGHKPYETTQVRQVLQLVKKGYRLPPPPGCPKKVYELMIQTWHPDVSGRPQPRDLLIALVRNVDEVMAVPAEDVPADSQAAVLGAPLHTASHLYSHLQNTYMQ